MLPVKKCALGHSVLNSSALHTLMIPKACSQPSIFSGFLPAGDPDACVFTEYVCVGSVPILYIT